MTNAAAKTEGELNAVLQVTPSKADLATSFYH